jgi:hypothetical protein
VFLLALFQRVNRLAVCDSGARENCFIVIQSCKDRLHRVNHRLSQLCSFLAGFFQHGVTANPLRRCWRKSDC